MATPEEDFNARLASLGFTDPSAPAPQSEFEKKLAALGYQSPSATATLPAPKPAYTPPPPNAETQAHAAELAKQAPIAPGDYVEGFTSGLKGQLSGFAAPTARFVGGLAEKFGASPEPFEQYAQRREMTAEAEQKRSEAAKVAAGMTPEQKGGLGEMLNPQNVAQSIGQAAGSLAFMVPAVAAYLTGAGEIATLGIAGASMLPIGAGEIYDAVQKATGKKELGKATLYGIPYAAVEVADEIFTLSRGKAAAKTVEGLGKAILQGSAAGFFGEPAEEVVQDKIKQFAVNMAQGQSAADSFKNLGWSNIPQEYKDYIVSMGPGMLLYGGGGAALGHFAEKKAAEYKKATEPIVSPAEVEAFKAEEAKKLEAEHKAKKAEEATAAPTTVLAGGIPGPKESKAEKAAAEKPSDVVVAGSNLTTGEKVSETAAKMNEEVKAAVAEEVSPTPKVPKETPEQEKARLDAEKTQRDLDAKQKETEIKQAEIAAQQEADRVDREAELAHEAELARIKQADLDAKLAHDTEQNRLAAEQSTRDQEQALADAQAASATSDQAVADLAIEQAQKQQEENVLAAKEGRKPRTIPKTDLHQAVEADTTDTRIKNVPFEPKVGDSVEMDVLGRKIPVTITGKRKGGWEVEMPTGEKRTTPAATIAPMSDAAKSVKPVGKQATADEWGPDAATAAPAPAAAPTEAAASATVAPEAPAVAETPVAPVAPVETPVTVPAAPATSEALVATDTALARVAEMRSAKVPVSKKAVVDYAKQLEAAGVIGADEVEDVSTQGGGKYALDQLETHLNFNRNIHQAEAQSGTGRAQAADRTPQAEQRGAGTERVGAVGSEKALQDAKAIIRGTLEAKLKAATGMFERRRIERRLERLDGLKVAKNYVPQRNQTAAANLAGEVGREIIWLDENEFAGGFFSPANPNQIFISVKSKFATMQVVLHEIKHSLDFEGKTNQQVQDILDRVHSSIMTAAGKTSEDFKTWRKGYDKQMGYTADDAEAWEEYTAEIFQDAGMNAEFYRTLRNINPALYDAIMGAYDRIVGAILESKVGREVAEKILGVETIKTYIANKTLGRMTPIKSAEVFAAIAKAIDEMSTLVKAGKAGIQTPAEAAPAPAAAPAAAASTAAAPAAAAPATAPPAASEPAVVGGVRTKPSSTPEVAGVPRTDLRGKRVKGTVPEAKEKKGKAKGKPLEMQDKSASKRAKPGRAYSFDEDGNMIEAPASNFVSSVEGPVIVDEEKGVATPDPVRMSRASYEAGKESGYYERVLSQIVKSGIATQAEANRFIDAIDSVSAQIFENRGFLDYEAEGKGVFDALKSNADAQYGRSLDFTTICRKTAKLFATVSEIMRVNEKGLSAEQITSIRQELFDSGEQVNCAACYVFSRWVNMGNILDNMAEQFPNVPKDLIYDPRRSAELARDYPDAWAWKKARGSGAGKAIETRTEYDPGEIKRYFNPKRVHVQNLFSGMRMQSWSDFDPLHVIDLVQAVADMASIKLAAHGYTKVADFVRLMAPAGASVNMSLIPKGTGFDAKGQLLFDDIEGMPAAEAFALRAQHATAGTVAIGISREHIMAMMADPRIDYIIPYHASGLSKAFQQKAGMEKWSDFTKTQGDKVVDKALFKARMDRVMAETGMTKAQAKRIMPFEYWDSSLTGDQNAQRFLDYAKSVGVKPRFAQFLNLDGTAPSGYWKLLIDRKMYDTSGKYVEQGPMKLNIDMGVVNDIFSRFLAGEGAVTDLAAAHEATVEKFTQKVPAREQAAERTPSKEDWLGKAHSRTGAEKFATELRLKKEAEAEKAKTTTFGMDAAAVSPDITWDVMRANVTRPEDRKEAVRWIMPDGTKIGRDVRDQHSDLAGPNYQTLIHNGAVRVRMGAGGGVVDAGREINRTQQAVLKELYAGLKDVAVFYRPSERREDGRMGKVEGENTADKAIEYIRQQHEMRQRENAPGPSATMREFHPVWESNLQAAERKPIHMDEEGGIVLDRSNGVVYVGADLVNVDEKGRQAKTGILYPTETGSFTVGEGVAKNIQKHIDAGFTTVVIVGYKNLQTSMDANPLFHRALGRALKAAYGPVITEEIYAQARVKREAEMDAFKREERKSQPKSVDHLALGIANSKVYSGRLLPGQVKVTLDAVAEGIAAPGWENMLGKAVGVGEHVSISKAEAGNLYPFEIKFKKYYQFKNPVDFDKVMDESSKKQLHKDNRWLMLRSGTLSMARQDHPVVDTLIKAAKGEVSLQAGERTPLEVDRQTMMTQRANTVKTYRNIAPLLKGRVLDYGAGMGVGADELRSQGLNVESFEPNTDRWQGKEQPTYTDTENITGQYDSITNFSVLNVLRPPMRRFVVERIGELLAPGGTAHITARTKREVEANKTKRPAQDGWITGDNQFQKGFENSKELRDYVADVLGEGFDVKIGKGLSGTYVTATKTGDVRLQAQPRTPGSSEYWIMRPLGRLTNSIRNFQNRMVDVKDAMWSIENMFGPIPEQLNIDMNQKVYLSMLKDAVEGRYRYGFKPILEAMAHYGETVESAGQYLIDRRIPEFNDLMATRNPNWVPSTPNTTAEAQARIAAIDPARMAGLNAIADMVDEFRKETHKQMVAYHLESQSTIDAWEAQHPSWISFQREGADDYGFGGNGGGQGFNIKGSQGKVAFGSALPINPSEAFASLISTAENTIKRGIKNTTVGHSTFGAAIMFPNPKFWKAIRPADVNNPSMLAALAVELENEFGIPQADTMNLFKEDQQPTLDRRTKEAVFRVNPQLRNAPYAFATRVNGENRYVFFNKRDEQAMAMVRALKNQDLDPMVTELTWAAKFTRYYASVSTQWNPFFGIKNLGRDALEAAVTLQRTPIAGSQLALWKNIPAAVVAGWKRQRALRTGTNPPQGGIYRWNNEFIGAGGPTGHLDYFENNAERAKQLNSEMKYLTAKGWKKGLWTGGKYIMGLSEDFNTAMENATRLSAYKVAREKGMTQMEAAVLAKELTVNFNDKGRKSSNYNALFAFFNASIQGTATVARTMFEQDAQGKTVLSRSGKQVLAGGFALGAMQVMLLMGAGFKPDQPPDWVKDNNFIIPNPADPNHPFMIPMPLGFSFMVNMGRRSLELATGASEEDKAKQMTGMLTMLMNAQNPLGDVETGFAMVTPTPLKPFESLRSNKDWKNQPIARLDFNTQKPTPGFTRARDTASWTSKQLSVMLDYITGGDGVDPGAWSPTPDQIDFLAASAVGGLGREVTKGAATIEALRTGEPLPSYKVPLVSSYVTTTGGPTVERTTYYDNLAKAFSAKAHLDHIAEEDGDVDAYIAAHPEATVADQITKIDGQIKKMHKAKAEARKTGDMETVNDMELGMRELMQTANEIMKEAKSE